MSAASIQTRSLIDEFLPTHDFSAAYKTRIFASPPVVYRTLLRSDFSELWLVRFLMTLRARKWIPRSSGPRDLRKRLQGTGFVILAEVPNDELVIGVAGQFWRLDGGRCTDLTAGDFMEFSRSGFAKAAWNFKTQSDTAETTVLSTETRIECFGQKALWKFRLYWTVVGVFSGLMRKAILNQIKRKAESFGRSEENSF